MQYADMGSIIHDEPTYDLFDYRSETPRQEVREINTDTIHVPGILGDRI